MLKVLDSNPEYRTEDLWHLRASSIDYCDRDRHAILTDNSKCFCTWCKCVNETWYQPPYWDYLKGNRFTSGELGALSSIDFESRGGLPIKSRQVGVALPFKVLCAIIFQVKIVYGKYFPKINFLLLSCCYGYALMITEKYMGSSNWLPVKPNHNLVEVFMQLETKPNVLFALNPSHYLSVFLYIHVQLSTWKQNAAIIR